MAKRWYCKVMFPETPNREYTFGTCIPGLQPGDPVIVETSRGLNHAIFVEYGGAWSHAVKFVLAKTDQNSLDATRAHNWHWCSKCGDKLDQDGQCPECSANHEEQYRKRADTIIMD